MASLLDWSRRCGFGQATGVDLPREVAGHLPAFDVPADRHHAGQDSAAAALAIGQSSLTVTPLQIARWMAAIANGGKLVTPHVAQEFAAAPNTSDNDANSPPIERTAATSIELTTQVEFPPPRPIAGLDPQRLEILRHDLRQVVADPEGTARGLSSRDRRSRWQNRNGENRGRRDRARLVRRLCSRECTASCVRRGFGARRRRRNDGRSGCRAARRKDASPRLLLPAGNLRRTIASATRRRGGKRAISLAAATRPNRPAMTAVHDLQLQKRQ